MEGIKIKECDYLGEVTDEIVVCLEFEGKTYRGCLSEFDKEKFECGDCGCFFWVENRNDFECPNCEVEK